MTTHPEAFALRPIRIDPRKGELTNYEGTTFPENPQAGCDMYLRRLKAFGFIREEDGPLGLDVLAENGDILDTITISRDGFEYLRGRLKFKRERP